MPATGLASEPPFRCRYGAMKSLLHTAALCVGLLIAPASVLAAPDADTKADPKDDRTEAPALPADASARQSMRLAGRTLDYTATVGTLPVRDAKGKVIADVVFTAYTMPGKDRPVTFALNGGPGASSVYLNMGAIGPKVVSHHRLVRETGQHDVLQLIELLAQRRIDARVGVAEQIGPPGADAIQPALTRLAVQPHALPAHDGKQRQGMRAGLQMVLHLGAGVPHGGRYATPAPRVGPPRVAGSSTRPTAPRGQR